MAKYTREPFGIKIKSDLNNPSKDQYAVTYDVLSEGPIEGLDNGLASIFINDVPIIQANAENILKPRRFKATTTVGGTITHAQIGEIGSLEYLNRTGLAIGSRTLVIDKAGAKGTGIATTTAGATRVTTSSAFFTTQMLSDTRSKAVNVYLTIVGAGPNGTDFRTRLKSVTNSQTAEVITPIPTAVSGADIFFDLKAGIQSINGNVATLSPTPQVAITNAHVQIGSPNLALNLTKLFNFQNIGVGFRVGEKIQPFLGLDNRFGTSSVVYAPNLELEQADLRAALATERSQLGDGNLVVNYNNELEEPSQVEGTAADTILTSAILGVTNPSEVDEIHLTFNLPASHALKSNGTKGSSFVELQIFFEYSTDGGSTYTRELAYGPSNADIIQRSDGKNGRNVNFATNGNNLPSNGYIRPTKPQFTSFVEEFVINTEEFQPYDDFRIVVRRVNDLNPKDKSFRHTNPCILQTVESIVKDKLTYPYSSYGALQFNAKDFDNSFPTRAYVLKGRKVKVPTNYFTREENGNNTATYTRNVTSGADAGSYQNWDGNFRGDKSLSEGSVNFEEVYTDNPVWIFYDLLTNNRYGLGEFINEDDIDKYELFRLAKYCDELVPDGQGGTEPRFTCNVYLSQPGEATNVLNQFVTIFRGMALWIDGQITAMADRPIEPVYTFSKANVKDGAFVYEGTGDRTRTNQVKVTWNDPSDNYQQTIEYVEDSNAIAKANKIVRSDLLAFGTTSRGQAHRLGKWKLLSEQNEKETVTFVTGLNALGLKPGDLIKVQDADKDRTSFSGRVTNFSPEAGLTLDSTFNLINGGAIQIGGGSNDTYPGGYFYTSSQESDKVLFAGEVTLPSSFSQAAVLWEHGGTGVGSWLGVRQLNGVYNLTLRSGEGSTGTAATSADGIVTNVPIADIPEFDGGVHTICWAFRPDATPGTQKLWIDGKLYINDQTSSGTMEANEWSGGGHGGWLRATDATSGGLSTNAWPTTEGASGLRHYFGEDAGSNLGLTTTEILLDRNIDLPDNSFSSGFPPQLLLIYPEGGAYLNQDSATIGGTAFTKGQLIPSITSSSAAANATDSSTNAKVDVFWSENARIEKQTVHSSTGTSSTNKVIVTSAFTAPPSPETMWALQIFNADGTEAVGSAKEFKIASIKESEEKEMEIVATAFDRTKFDVIERGVKIDPRPVATVPDQDDEIPAPGNLAAKLVVSETAAQTSDDSSFETKHDVEISWDFPKNSDGSLYGFVGGFEVTHDLKGKKLVELLGIKETSLTVENVVGGDYKIDVRTISNINTYSLAISQDFTFSQLHFSNPKAPNKKVKAPIGGLITAPLSIDSSNGTVSVGNDQTSSATFKFTNTNGITREFTKSTHANMFNTPATLNGVSGDSGGNLSVLVDDSANSLKFVVQVTDTTASPAFEYLKIDGASSEGLSTKTGTVSVERFSNKIEGTGTSFSTHYSEGDVIHIANGSTTTATTNGSVSNSTAVTLASSNSNIKVGQTVTGTITGPSGTVSSIATASGTLSVVAISGTSLTLSAPVTVGSGVTLTFTPRTTYRTITNILSDTLLFVDEIVHRKYTGAVHKAIAFTPDSIQDTIIADVKRTTVLGNSTFSITTQHADFPVADNALTLDQISDATIVTESEGIGSNDNDTTIPTSAAVKDYVENNAAAGTVDTTGTPADNQIAIFTDSNTLEGDSKLTFDGATLEVLKNGATAVIKVHEDAGTHTARFHLREGTQDTYLQNRPGNGFEIRTEGNISTSNNAAMQINSAGNITAGYNLTVSGNLTVDGTTTTINTADLNVEDKNITLNYHASNDTSSTANGSGITIQDAVDASTDATLLWDATNDEFDFSHKVTAPALSTTGGIVSATANGLSQKHFELIDSADTSIRANIYHDNGIMSIESNNNTAAGQIVFKRRPAGTTVETARFDASGNFQFGASPTTILDPSRNLFGLESIKLLDDKELRIGTASDFVIKHTSSGGDTHLNNITGDLFISNFADDRDVFFRSDDGSGGITSYFFLDGSSTKTVFTQNAQFDDNKRLLLGGGGDFQAYHDTSDTLFRNFTGDLYLQVDTDNGSIFMRSDDGSGGVTNYLRINGSDELINFHKNSKHMDNVKATFGDSGDLEIYHDGTHSYIEETNATGNLYIRGESIDIRRQANGEQYILAQPNGAVTLFHDGNTRLATTATGIDVTSTIELGDGHLIGNDSFDNLTLLSSSGEHIVLTASEDIYFKTGGSSLSSTGNTRMHVDATTGYVGIGALNASSRLLLHGGGSYNQLRLEESATDNQDKRAGLSFTQYDVDEEGFLGIGGFASSTENAVLLGGGTGTFNAATRVDIVTAANNTTTAGSVRMRIDSSGNVGIGTTSPATKLHISESSSSTTPSIRITNDTPESLTMGVVRSGAGTAPDTAFIQFDNALRFIGQTGTTNERMRITEAGNVGIATDSPAEKLDVLGVGKVRGTGDGTAVLKLGQRDNNASMELVSIFTDDAGSTRSLGGDALEFHTNRHLQVIGATRSSAAGSPVRTWKFTATSNSDERGTDLLLYNQADASATGSTTTTVGVQISSTSNRSTYFNGGNVGIGTTSPSASGSRKTLHINSDTNGSALRLSQSSNSALIRYDTTNGLQVGTISSHNLILQTADTTAITIDTSQRVGIGGSPSYKLDVGGATASTSNTLRLRQNNGGTAIRIGSGSGDSDIVIWRIDGAGAANAGATDAGNYGFSLKYFGSGTGNENRLKLLADNQANATQNVVWESNQTGTITFQQNVILSSTTNLKHNTDTILDTNKNLSNIANISHSGGFTQNAGTTVNSTYVYSTNTSGQPGFVAANNTSGNADRSLLMKYYGTAVSATIFGQNVGGKVIVAASGSANGGLLLGSGNSATNAPVYMGTGGNLALTIDTSQNVTLENNLIFGNGSITSDSTEFIFDGADGKEVIIKSARDVRIIIDDNNDDSTNEFEIFKHNDDSASNKILNLTQAGALTINSAYTFPTADGSANQVLQTDGSGNLSFATNSGTVDTNGTPVDGQIAIFADADTIEGNAGLTFGTTADGSASQNALEVRGGGTHPPVISMSNSTGSSTTTYGTLGFDGTNLTLNARAGASKGGIKFQGNTGVLPTTYGGFDASGNFEIGSTDIIDSSRNMSNIGTFACTGNINATGGTSHTFYSNGSSGQLQVGRGSNQEIQIYVDDSNNKITAFQDSDSDGTHRFILDREFDGSGANTFHIRKDGADQFTLDGSAKATFHGEVHIPGNVVHVGDTDTYYGFHGNNLWRVVTGGLERFEVSDSGIIINDNGAAMDFRVESDNNANMLFVDGTNDRVGIGTGSPDGQLDVRGTSISTILARATSGNSQARVMVQNDARAYSFKIHTDDTLQIKDETADAARIKISTGGNVSIGGDPNPGGTTATLSLGPGSNATESLVFAPSTGGVGEFRNTSSSGFFKFTNQNGSTELVRIDSSGKVGIGTDSPETNLEVSNSSGAATIRISNESNIVAAGGDLGIIEFYSGDNSNSGDSVQASLSVIQPTTDNVSGEFVFKTSNAVVSSGALTEKMRITKEGRVGIGTDSPDENLHIKDTGNADLKIERASGAAVFGQAQASAGVLGTSSNHRLDLKSNGSTRLSIANTGAITFNTAYTFPTSDGSANQVLQTDGSGNLSFADAGGGTITSASNMVDNRVLTASGSTTINGESNLTFDGSTLTLTGDMTITDTSTDPFIRFNTSEREYVVRIDNSDADKFQIRDVTGGLTRFTLTSGGNVGIGTTSPNQKLEVAGRVRATTDPTFEAYGGSTTNRGGLQWQSTNNNLNIFSGGSSSGDEFITFQTNTTEKMRLAADGKLGIGTSSPASKLHVYNSSGTTPAFTTFNAGNSSDITSFTAEAGLQLISYQSEGNPYTKTSALIANADGTVPSEMQFWTKTNGASSAAERMRIDSSGNVGIGTTSPTRKLSVVGGVAGFGNGTIETIISYSDRGIFGTQSNHDLEIRTNGSERMRITSGGNLGLGTTTPHSGTRAQICADDTTPSLNSTAIDDCTLVLSNSDDDYGTVFASDGTGKGYIQQRRTATATYYDLNLQPYGGNVGIGTASPNHTLDIVGTNGVEITTEESTDAIALLDSNNSNTKYLSIQGDSGDCNINAPAGSLVLQRAGTNRLTVNTTGVSVNGLLSATTKSFIIDHPTKEGMKLRYGSLEGPENGVYARGRLRGNIIELPEYWTELVHEDSITVNLTPIGKHQKLYVEDIKDNQVIVGNENLLGKEINCFYTVYAERKDVEKFEVEYNE